MSAIVSSRLDYLNKNPGAKTSFGEIAHELEHLKIRERVGSFVTLSGTVLLMVSLAGILGGGAFLLGALAAIAAVAALYTYFTREAESALRGKQVQWLNIDTQNVEKEHGFLGLDWFSK